MPTKKSQNITATSLQNLRAFITSGLSSLFMPLSWLGQIGSHINTKLSLLLNLAMNIMTAIKMLVTSIAMVALVIVVRILWKKSPPKNQEQQPSTDKPTTKEPVKDAPEADELAISATPPPPNAAGESERTIASQRVQQPKSPPLDTQKEDPPPQSMTQHVPTPSERSQDLRRMKMSKVQQNRNREVKENGSTTAATKIQSPTDIETSKMADTPETVVKPEKSETILPAGSSAAAQPKRQERKNKTQSEPSDKSPKARLQQYKNRLKAQAKSKSLKPSAAQASIKPNKLRPHTAIDNTEASLNHYILEGLKQALASSDPNPDLSPFFDGTLEAFCEMFKKDLGAEQMTLLQEFSGSFDDKQRLSEHFKKVLAALTRDVIKRNMLIICIDSEKAKLGILRLASQISGLPPDEISRMGKILKKEILKKAKDKKKLDPPPKKKKKESLDEQFQSFQIEAIELLPNDPKNEDEKFKRFLEAHKHHNKGDRFLQAFCEHTKSYHSTLERTLAHSTMEQRVPLLLIVLDRFW